MMRHFFALLMFAAVALVHAKEPPSVDTSVIVTHVAKDTWRVDYQFAQPVSAIKLESIGEYRQKAWKSLTPGIVLKADSEMDVITSEGKPFSKASIEISTFDGLAPKAYPPFNRFSDGGTAVFLGFMQGDAVRGKQTVKMATDIKLTGLAEENVIAPPVNKLVRGGDRGYAYFGPAQPVKMGSTQFLIDPKTPVWMRDVLLDASTKTSAYYAKAYQRPLQDELLVMFSVSGFEEKGLAMRGGAVMGQLSYRFDGQVLIRDHPKYREVLNRLVAHEIAHLWQMNVSRGGIGDNDPWIHEGGAEAMALDALQQTGLWTAETAAAYRKAQSATCDKLGNSVESFDGIYACGLVRFDKLGVDIVPLWRTMITTSEAKGEFYSPKMVEAMAPPAIH